MYCWVEFFSAPFSLSLLGSGLWEWGLLPLFFLLGCWLVLLGGRILLFDCGVVEWGEWWLYPRSDSKRPNIDRLKEWKDIDGLVRALSYPRNAFIRAGAARALGELGAKGAVEVLVKALSDWRIEVRRAALDALKRLGWEPRTELEKAQALCIDECLDEAGKLGVVAVAPLIQILKEEPPPFCEDPEDRALLKELHWDAWYRLEIIGREEERYNRGMYFELQEWAASIIRSFGSAAVGPVLKAGYQGKYVTGFLSLAKGSDVDLLLEAFRERESLRDALIVALGHTRDKRAVELIKPFLRKGDVHTQKRAADALERIGLEPEDDDEDAWYSVAKQDWSGAAALGAAAIDALIEAMGTSLEYEGDTVYPPQVSWDARDALSTIGEPAVGALLKVIDKVEFLEGERVEGAVGALCSIVVDGKIKNEAVEKEVFEYLIELFLKTYSGSSNVSQTIGYTLLDNIEYERIISALVRQLANPSPQIRDAAIQHLVYMEVSGSDLSKVLDAMGESGPIEAVLILAERGIIQDNRQILRCLEGRSWHQRRTAIDLLKDSKDPQVLEHLAQMLERQDCSELHTSIAEILVRHDDRRVEVPMLAILKRSTMSIDERAVQVLAQLDNTEALEFLIQHVNNKDSYIHYKAIEVLGYFKTERVLTFLIRILLDEDLKARSAATWALGRIGDSRVVEPLIHALQDTYWGARQVAARFLGQIGDNRAVEELVQILTDENSGVRKAAFEALRQLGWKPETALDTARYILGGGWLDKPITVVVDSAVVEVLFELLREDENRYISVRAALDYIAVSDVKGVEKLITALQDENEYVRSAASYALATTHHPRATEILAARLLKDKSFIVLREVATALKTMLGWTPKTDKEKARFFVGLSNWQEVEALGSAAIEALSCALSSPSWQIRKAAALSLGKTGDPQAIPPLGRAALDSIGLVKKAAVYALGEIGGTEVVEPLTKALPKLESPAKRKAIEILSKMEDPRTIPALIECLGDSSVRNQVQIVLSKFKTPETEELLIKALQRESWWIRYGVAYILGKWRSVSAIEPLTQALKDESEEVRSAAKRALERIKEKREPSLS